jgi:hypothetical protein
MQEPAAFLGVLPPVRGCEGTTMTQTFRKPTTPMHAGAETGPTFVGTRPSLRAEPGLDELLQDPIMTLLWRRDRLAPDRARTVLRDLQMLVRRAANDAGPP